MTYTIKMDPSSKWKMVLARSRRRLLPLDIMHCSPLALRSIILDVRTSASVLDRIAEAYYDDESMMKDLVRCPNLSETTLAFIALTASEDIRMFIARTRVMDVVMGEADAAAAGAASAGAGKAQKQKLNVQQIINRMTTPQKIKLALSGGKDARGLLVRESNKQIALSVLENPRITDGEIEFFAQSQNLSDDVMRTIGTNPDWCRKYNIVRCLVNNPKTPVGVAMGFVNRMTDRDLDILEKSRNVSEAVRTAAKNLAIKRKLGKQGR